MSWTIKNDTLIEHGHGGRRLFTLIEQPGLGNDAEKIMHLLTAAPDMIDALKNAAGLLDTPLARRRHGDDPFYAAVVASIRAAIARAEGRDQ